MVSNTCIGKRKKNGKIQMYKRKDKDNSFDTANTSFKIYNY